MNDPTKNTALDDLEALVSTLDTKLGATGSLPASARNATGSLTAGASRRPDALDAILGSEPRTTRMKPLRDHETVQRFRKEFSDGLIRVDTTRQLLGLIRLAVDAVMK